MKRIIIPALLVFCVLLLPAKEQSFAEEAMPISLTSLQWHLLQPNVTKTDLGGILPEVIILTLSNEQFEKIHASTAAAKEYLNDQKIFKKPLLKVIFCNVKSNAGGAQWILIIPHTYQSTGCIVAWQVPKKREK